ncbi:heme A synthase [Aquitalea sp. LB_tupeE]|uniref:COX15/CtaA family protein n=1 Tax=Aquitalea sp. LB_tupeE TaxID=2748078 RepID=UPI0015B9CBAC|nr:COX15/CtaA family protein [Aquitalea sp. LB_tupeE]NWK77999.1 COX15/CtaA family protein [Aquitalea sp. LB_tupeE]
MRKLLWLAVLLAFILLPLGAYVRLSQAGLGCPDWPGCFGQPSPAQAAQDIAHAMQLHLDGPVSTDKAWKEMTHRYLAAGLGLLLLAYCGQAWRTRQQRLAASGLLVLLLLQAMLGMLTVTLQLRPLIVASHLLLGMCLFALLCSTACARYWPSQAVAPSHWRLAALLLLVLAGQIGLGGWMAANQAALACQGFPRCNGDWWPTMQLSAALPVWPGASPLSLAALVALHWVHRVGAALLSGLLLLTLWRLWFYPSLRRQLCLLGLLAGLQLLLGMANVLLQRPLPIALAHHVLAMLLLATACGLLCRLHARTARYVASMVQHADRPP